MVFNEDRRVSPEVKIAGRISRIGLISNLSTIVDRDHAGRDHSDKQVAHAVAIVGDNPLGREDDGRIAVRGEGDFSFVVDGGIVNVEALVERLAAYDAAARDNGTDFKCLRLERL